MPAGDDIDVIDKDFEDAIRKALAHDPKLAERCIALMVLGCDEIDKFEDYMAIARQAPFSEESSPQLFHAALDKARDAFGSLIDIFGELLAIATGNDTGGA